ncbi:MAG TPA: transcription termination/antitermination NusG family protein, partial [Sporichthya sp.]|nr:transcription termination/antitermination NusG family protein [Sporichthya sp.]
MSDSPLNVDDASPDADAADAPAPADVEAVEAVEVDTPLDTPSEDAPAGDAPAEDAAAEGAPALDVVLSDGPKDDEDELDEAEEFRKALYAAPGDWYVVHSYAGYENRVKANLENRTASLNMEDFIFQIEVPQEEVVEIKNGQRKNVRRNKFPGYVLVRMDLTDESWSAVRHTPGVTGFVGHTHEPSPLTLDEVMKILAPEPAR